MTDNVINEFLLEIKSLKKKINKIYLFGSRARKDFRKDSDYDLLIVTNTKDANVKDKLYEKAFDTTLATGKYVSLKIFNLKEFNRLASIPTIFMRNILKEGISIG